MDTVQKVKDFVQSKGLEKEYQKKQLVFSIKHDEGFWDETTYTDLKKWLQEAIDSGVCPSEVQVFKYGCKIGTVLFQN